jgi:lysophospholipase L1-like esterase
MNRTLGRVALLVGSVAISIVATEQLLRLLDYEYRPVSVEVGDTEDARLYHLFGSEHFVYDPELIWKPRPGVSVFNEEGFRGPLMGGAREPGRLRIIAVGDSNTLGWAGPSGSSWPAALGQLLERKGISADVVNAGVWGYSSLQGVGRVRQIVAREPDIVLISFGSNDAVRVAIPDRRFAGKSERRRVFERWFNGFRVGQLTTAVANSVRRGGRHLVPRVELSEYRENLHEMTRLASAAGAQPVLLTRPFELQIPDDTWWKNFGGEYNLATAEVAVELGVPVVDFYSYFKGHRELFADESHFTGRGHAEAARILFEDLSPILVDVAGRQSAMTGPPRRIAAERRAGG